MQYVVYAQDRSGLFLCSGMFNTWHDAYKWQQNCLQWSPVAYIHSSECFNVDELNEIAESYNG